jgi:hypothetical protein
MSEKQVIIWNISVGGIYIRGSESGKEIFYRNLRGIILNQYNKENME